MALIVAGMRPRKRAPQWAGSAEATSAEGGRSARACTPVPEGRDVDRRSRERNANAGLRSGNAKSRAVSNHRPCSSMAALRIISSVRRRRERSQCAKREREAPRRLAESKTQSAHVGATMRRPGRRSSAETAKCIALDGAIVWLKCHAERRGAEQNKRSAAHWKAVREHRA